MEIYPMKLRTDELEKSAKKDAPKQGILIAKYNFSDLTYSFYKVDFKKWKLEYAEKANPAKKMKGEKIKINEKDMEKIISLSNKLWEYEDTRFRKTMNAAATAQIILSDKPDYRIIGFAAPMKKEAKELNEYLKTICKKD